ncbi:hypothetical protein BpHYR1_015316 [Brachionus plicatilis]|uniref:Secreted protein n=1 Tax=Brachionus plicatilis TaxID=10195 RepID=A0A3M7QDM3_BRAPC|nr:hypothetical protein BpHYR1_015316 [Brachionus plicatilis]
MFGIKHCFTLVALLFYTVPDSSCRFLVEETNFGDTPNNLAASFCFLSPLFSRPTICHFSGINLEGLKKDCYFIIKILITFSCLVLKNDTQYESSGKLWLLKMGNISSMTTADLLTNNSARLWLQKSRALCHDSGLSEIK